VGGLQLQDMLQCQLQGHALLLQEKSVARACNTVKQLQSFHSGPELLSEATMLYSTLGRSVR